MPSTSAHSSATRPLSTDAIEASHALASRERQDAATKKRGAGKRVSLGGSPALLSEETIVLAKRREYAESEAARLAARPAAVEIDPKLRLKGVDEDGKSFADASPERINQARVGQEVTVVAGVRQFADPFAVLRNKRILDKEDARINEALYQAGLKFRSLRAAAFPGIKAIDLTKDIVDGGLGHDGCPATDHAMDARKKLCEAYEVVGSRLMPYLVGVVVEDRPVEALAGMVAESKNATLATMLAVERLRQALHQLAGLWKLYPDDRPRGISSSIGQENMREFERRARKGG